MIVEHKTSFFFQVMKQTGGLYPAPLRILDVSLSSICCTVSSVCPAVDLVCGQYPPAENVLNGLNYIAGTIVP